MNLCSFRYYTKYLVNVDLVNADLVYVNFNNTTFQKVPIPHLTCSMKLALNEDLGSGHFQFGLHKIWFTQFFPRTKSSVNQGVGVNTYFLVKC